MAVANMSTFVQSKIGLFVDLALMVYFLFCVV